MNHPMDNVSSMGYSMAQLSVHGSVEGAMEHAVVLGARKPLVNPVFELQARWFQVIVLVVPTGRDNKRVDLGGYHGIHQRTPACKTKEA